MNVPSSTSVLTVLTQARLGELARGVGVSIPSSGRKDVQIARLLDAARLPLPALQLDARETVTGGWDYPPSAKFDRLLRHAGVPIGLLSNGNQVRLLYAPHGASIGALTFPIGFMATSAGRPVLDAFVMLLHATRRGQRPAPHRRRLLRRAPLGAGAAPSLLDEDS